MNKVLSIVILVIVLGCLVYMGTHQHTSYSGASYHLSLTGQLEYNDSRTIVFYYSDGQYLTRDELQCLARLAKIYKVEVLSMK